MLTPYGTFSNLRALGGPERRGWTFRHALSSMRCEFPLAHVERIQY